ncbi:MAG: hypothetical protein CM15mV17_1490 [Caudoviricetes sp.]|nr:MAG: hypothetical protein CM15mV17_1490 [Caudoviricetes sp.]
MTTSFLKDIIKDIGNDYASVVSDGVAAGDVSSFVDTGSYIFNALVSGSIYGGLPSNKITAIAGESSTGKTFLLLVSFAVSWSLILTVLYYTLNLNLLSPKIC